MAFNWFKKLKTGLSKSAQKVEKAFTSVIGKKKLDENSLTEIEDQLISSDLGVNASLKIVDKLRNHKFELTSKNKEISKEMILQVVKDELNKILINSEKSLFNDNNDKPHVILLIGVNGSGKTTTAGKIASMLKEKNKKVVIAACDTFRAAAVEQLQIWGDRIDVPVIAQQTGADSASVIYDAIESARAKDIDVVIADTAGRLHNKDNLMEELAKIKRVASKLSDNAPHEVLLVLDAATGQNALSQMSEFHKAVDVTGLVLTKLDGTAKGGILISLAKQFPVGIKYVGVGEGIDDLKVFEAELFVDALIDF